MSPRRFFRLSASVLAFGFFGVAQANIVDLFEAPQPRQSVVIGAGLGTTQSQFGSNSTILGGYRDLILEVTANDNDNGASANAGKTSGGNAGFSFSSGSGTNATARIQWDGNDSGAAQAADSTTAAAAVATLDKTGLQVGGIGANLVFQDGCPVTGCTTFITTVTEADLGFQYEIAIYTSATQFTRLIAISEAVVFGSPVVALYEFALFDGTIFPAGANSVPGFDFFLIYGAGGAADVENVGALEFIVNSTNNVGDPDFNSSGVRNIDLSLGAIEKTDIPEPGTLALLGLALVGAAASRSRWSGKAPR